MNSKLVYITILSILLLSGCVKDKLDFDMIDDLQYSPEVEVPLVSATLTLGDLVARDSSNTLVSDPNNLVRIRFEEEELFRFKTQDFVNIPDQDAVNFPVIVGQPPLDFSMSLGTIGGVELTETEFYEGYYKLTLKSSTPLTDAVEVKAEVLNTISGTQAIKNITLPAGSTSTTDSLPLPGVRFDFSNGGQNVNHIALKVEVINPPVTLTGTQLDLAIQFTQLELLEANGFFGDRSINIPSGSFDFDLTGFDNLFEGFFLKQPSIKLITASNVGVAVEISPDLNGVNSDGAVTSLNVMPQSLAAATDTMSYDTSEFSFNAGNSNIEEFLAALPSKVLYAGKAELNPGGYTTQNFLSRNSKITAGLEIDLPLELSIKNMRLEETISGIDIFSQNPEELKEVTLIFNSINEFPFDLNLKAAFLDSANGDSLHIVELGLLNAAQVDANGNILQPGVFAAPKERKLDGPILEKLKRSNRIVLLATLNTPLNGDKVEKFYTHFGLEINVAAKTKLKVNLSDQ
ncbi:MAG: hypothetical protein U5L96_07655 [Owenweeksia sp.]|nr:hypothetical protein [Owenweeksia sp.]